MRLKRKVVDPEVRKVRVIRVNPDDPKLKEEVEVEFTRRSLVREIGEIAKASFWAALAVIAFFVALSFLAKGLGF
ncbi:hypothetical protein [Thermus sp.]|uniref:hypothetical protein n=1 Tax=Thermus sp. TaxID=275 RepID=UPI00298EF869|nr:hypothetical protein [Thermus sp.]